MTDKNEIATAGQAGMVVANNQSFISEDIPMDKVKVPRLSLLQALSEQVTDLKHESGTFEDTITGINYGEKVALIPVKIGFGALYMDNEDGLKCKSNDGITNIRGEKCSECPFGVFYKDWAEDGTPPECSETVDVLCLEKEGLSPMIMTFKSSSYKEGKKLASALKFKKSTDAIILGRTQEKGKKGTYWSPKIERFEPIDEMQFEAAKSFREAVMAGRVEVEEKEASEDDGLN